MFCWWTALCFFLVICSESITNNKRLRRHSRRHDFERTMFTGKMANDTEFDILSQILYETNKSMVSFHHACIYMFQVFLVRNVIMDMIRSTIYIAFALLLNGHLAGYVPILYSCIKCTILQMFIVHTNSESGPRANWDCEKKICLCLQAKLITKWRSTCLLVDHSERLNLHPVWTHSAYIFAFKNTWMNFVSLLCDKSKIDHVRTLR